MNYFPFLPILLAITVLFTPILGNAKPQRGSYVCLTSRPDGMFSVLYDVLSMMKSYEAKQYGAVKVDFGTKGLYYSPSHGPNWWSYYFLPLELGVKSNKVKFKTICGSQLHYNPWWVESMISREEAATLTQKYIKVRPEILNDIDTYVGSNFSGYFIVGVHYRGTDKVIEAPRVKYENLVKAIDTVIKTCTTEYKIFVATDEKEFLNYILKVYGDKVCYLESAKRSTTGLPIHMHMTGNEYENGLSALKDCLLLSKTNFLIRTSSNLSKFSTYFNLDLPVVELNQRY